MSDPKVQAMAKGFLGDIGKMIDSALKELGVDLKKNPKAYYKSSRYVFKAIMAAAAQKMLDDGANTRLLADTYNPSDAWELYLTRHPDIAAKLTPKPPKSKPKLELIDGGKEETAEVPDAPLVLECASGCHGVFTSVEEWQNHECHGDKKGEECDCSCHDLAVPAGCGNCECINEAKGDEVL